MPLTTVLKKGLWGASIRMTPLRFQNLRSQFFSTTSKHFDNPLIPAIHGNSPEAVVKILKQGEKAKLADLKEAFRHGVHTLKLEIVDALVHYNALPQGVSLQNLQLFLWAMGHPNIKIRDIKGAPNLTTTGIPGMPSPMLIVASDGNFNRVVELVSELSDSARPIDQLLQNIESGDFFGCNFLNVNGFKGKITKKLAAYRLEDLCRIVRYFLLHPTEDLYHAFERQHQTLKTDGLYYLPFFAWLAVNNNTELFADPNFIELMRLDRKSAKQVVVIATAFGSSKFLLELIKANLIDQEDIEIACNLAAANGDTRLLAILLPLHLHKGVQCQTVTILPPLFWAIRNGHKYTVEFLLQSGISPNSLQGELGNDSYLHLAARLATNEDRLIILKLLIDNGAEIDHINKIEQTPLHQALEMYASEKRKKRDLHKAILMLVKTGKTDLDRAKDGKTTRELLGAHMDNTLVSKNSERAVEKENDVDYVDEDRCSFTL